MVEKFATGTYIFLDLDLNTQWNNKFSYWAFHLLMYDFTCVSPSSGIFFLHDIMDLGHWGCLYRSQTYSCVICSRLVFEVSFSL
jgi:hypothetical protein